MVLKLARDVLRAYVSFCFFHVFILIEEHQQKKHQKTPSNELLFIHILAQGQGKLVI